MHPCTALTRLTARAEVECGHDKVSHPVIAVHKRNTNLAVDLGLEKL